MHEINEKMERLYSGWPVSYKNTYSRTFSINFSVNSSSIPFCPPVKTVSKTLMSTARRYLDWSAASARLLFDRDDAILRNTIRKPSRRGDRSLPAASARLLFDGDDAILHNTVRTPSRRRGSALSVWPNLKTSVFLFTVCMYPPNILISTA